MLSKQVLRASSLVLIISKNTPPKEMEGEINQKDGHEYIEWPDSSGRWFIRNNRTKLWDEWKD